MSNFIGNEVFQKSLLKLLPYLKLKQVEPLDVWSEKNIVLSSTYASEVGQFSCDFAPFQRQILRDMGDPLLPEGKLVLCCSSQIGKSQMLSNFLAYTMVNDPAPTLFVHYSLKAAQSFVKTRFRSMLRDIPVLKGMVEIDGKKTGNTIDFVEYPGGSISHVGSNSPGNLSARSVRYLLLDEVDRMVNNAEGDPVSMALARVKTFRNKKVLMVSSPANLEDSKIWWEFQNSDQRYYHVPCPHCHHEHVLDFRNMKWTEDVSEVWMECPECKGKIEQKHRQKMLDQGKWIPTDETKKIHGYHINEIYSPFSNWTDIVTRYIDANELAKTGDMSKLQVFKNTALALPWEEDITGDIDVPEFVKRTEEFSRNPKDYLVTTLGLDTQDNRVEGVLCGWGDNEECWVIDSPVFVGNPALPEFWKQIEDYIIENNVTCTNIDSGGHNTQMVYQFCKNNVHLRVHPIKGSGDNIRPICNYTPSFRNSKNVGLYFVGTIAAKDTLYSRAKLEKKSGGGVIHWHKDICNAEWFESFFSEKKVKTKQGNVSYVKLAEKLANEKLDGMVYSLHSVKLLNINWRRLIENSEKVVQSDRSEDQKIMDKLTSVPTQQPQIKPVNFKKSYINRW